MERRLLGDGGDSEDKGNGENGDDEGESEGMGMGAKGRGTYTRPRPGCESGRAAPSLHDHVEVVLYTPRESPPMSSQLRKTVLRQGLGFRRSKLDETKVRGPCQGREWLHLKR